MLVHHVTVVSSCYFRYRGHVHVHQRVARQAADGQARLSGSQPTGRLNVFLPGCQLKMETIEIESQEKHDHGNHLEYRTSLAFVSLTWVKLPNGPVFDWQTGQ